MKKKKEVGNKRLKLLQAFLLFAFGCPASLIGILAFSQLTLGNAADDRNSVVIPSMTVVVESTNTQEVDMNANLLAMLERELPLVSFLDVVVNTIAQPQIIQVVFAMPGGNNVDVSLSVMQDIVCALKAQRWDGYRYRMAARMPSGVTGITVALEPDVITEIDCSSGAGMINWEEAASEYSVASGLQ